MDNCNCNCGCNAHGQTISGCINDARQIVAGTVTIPVFRDKEAVEKTITPSGSEQVLEPASGTEFSKITVEPIPKNYGRISYDGVTIRVE